MQFRPEEENREGVAAAFDEQRAAILSLLPEARVEHIGATAVPGALTKGDLDLLVSVAAAQFEPAAATLRQRYAVNQPENWTAEFASFEQQPAGAIPVGVQLVAAGGRDEALFLEWRDRLRSEPQLRERFNAFKRVQAGADPEAYIEAKARFIETELGAGIAGTALPEEYSAPMAKPPEETVRLFIEALNRDDFDAAIALVHPEIEFVPPGGQPPYRGAESLRRWMEPDALEGQVIRPLESLEPAPGKVLVKHRVTARGASSGFELDVFSWSVWELDDAGLITRAQIFLEHEEDQAREAAGLAG